MLVDTPIPPVRNVETIPVTHEGTQYIVLRDPQGFSDSMIAVAPEALPILAMFDGSKSAQEIGEELAAATGSTFDPNQILAMVDVLDDAFLLENRNFLAHRIKVEEEFRALEIRPASLAGGGYPDQPDELRQFLNDLLASPPPVDFEPEELPANSNIRGMIIPHIDYARGGATYGRVYRRLLEMLPTLDEGPLLVGVIGVAHQGALTPVVACPKDFETPLGLLPYDRPAMKLIRDQLGDAPFREQWVHKAEHSVELQAVWLRHLFADRKITFLPLLAGILEGPLISTNGSSGSFRKIIDTMHMIEKQHPGPVLWIASVDFSHVGPQFGDPEAVDDHMIKQVEERDMEALDTLRAVHPEGWWSSLMQDDNRYRVCGVNATLIALELLSETQVSIVDYDRYLSRDGQLLVSYAAAVFLE